jgi:hypothetical protein
MSNHGIVTINETTIYGKSIDGTMLDIDNGNKIKNVRGKTILFLSSPLPNDIDVHFDWFGDSLLRREINLGPKFTRTVPANDTLGFGPFPKEMEDEEGYVRWTYTFHGFPFCSIYGFQLP